MPPRRVEAEPMCLREPGASASRPPGHERTLTVFTSCRTSRRPSPTSPHSRRPCTSDKGKSSPTSGFICGRSLLWRASLRRAGLRRRPPLPPPEDVAFWGFFNVGMVELFLPAEVRRWLRAGGLSRVLYIKQKRVRQAHPAIPCQFPFFDILLYTSLDLGRPTPSSAFSITQRQAHSMSLGALDELW